MSLRTNILTNLITLIFLSTAAFAQDAKVTTKLDPPQILVGDQARLFIEVQVNPAHDKLQGWTQYPDTFNHLEIVEKGKIDTIKQNDLVIYKQRLLVTGFDSGVYKIPSFIFPVISGSTTYAVRSDSLQLAVQTVAVDTTQPFKPIKGIIMVKSTWRDYIWYFVAAAIFIIFLVFIILYFIRNRKVVIASAPKGPVETLQQKTLRLLAELDAQQIWQSGQVKEYYVQLTDILRNYIEARFKTAAMELTTDELLETAIRNKEMLPHRELLAGILYTADLAKFAKSQPLPAEHVVTMDNTKQFVNLTTPSEIPTQPEQK